MKSILKSIRSFIADVWDNPRDYAQLLMALFALGLCIILVAYWLTTCVPAWLSGATLLDIPAFCLPASR